MSMQGMGDPKEMGRGLLRQGQFDEAAMALREAVAMDATDEEAWRLLGGALASKGDPNAAVDAFKQAVDLAPTAGRSHYNLALAYQSAGRLPDAKSSLERALSLDPGYEQARTRLGEVDRQMGASAPAAAPAGLASVGGGGFGSPGLASVGATPAQESGHTNIGGGNTSALSSLGGLSGVGGTSAPETGHTNIGGGNTSALGGLSGGAPQSAGPSLSPPQSAPPGGGGGGANVYPSSSPAVGYAPPPSLGMNYGPGANDQNTSGMKADVPYEVKGGWNWGAFYFGWLWLLNHGMVALGAGLLVGSIVGMFIPFVNILVFLGLIGVAIALGIKGNEIAWQNRRFQSVEQFRATQKTWAFWVLGIFLFNVLTAPIMAAILFPVFAQARQKALETQRRSDLRRQQSQFIGTDRSR